VIDLELLATQRAKALNQGEADWLKLLKEPSCDVMFSAMSDGEIHQIFNLCQSIEDFSVLSQSFADGISSGEESAFSVWKKKVIGNGQTLEEGLKAWHKAWAKNKKFAHCLSEIAPPKLTLAKETSKS
jgi:hypothetical protein